MARLGDEAETQAHAVGMAEIAGGRFRMGAHGSYPEEAPVREMEVGPFRIDVAPVTNRAFAAFVKATGHVTAAERPGDPADYPGMDPSGLKPGAVLFRPPRRSGAHPTWRDWWVYRPGACWLRPEAEGSVYRGRLEHPVVCIAYDDALAYATWAGKSLPTEAEWEFAARGGLDQTTYAWGDERRPQGRVLANTWTGDFPFSGAGKTSAVGAYPVNGYGLHDMIGNVWEWTTDYFSSSLKTSGCCGSSSREESFDPAAPEIRIARRVVKGGSHLCHESYCDRYRPAARQPQMEDTPTSHIGFRCVIRP